MKVLAALTLGLAGIFLIAYTLGGGDGALAMAIIVGGLGAVAIFK